MSFSKILVIIIFLLINFNTSAQLYKGKEFDTAFDGKPIPGGVLYSYNDLYITAVIKGIYEDPELCNSNFPNLRKNPPKLYKYYIQLTVSNAGKYPIRFLGVPTFSFYLRGTSANNAAKVCTNVGTRPGSISLDLRTIGPNGKIVFNDVSDGGLFREMPSISRFKISHYRILNPNIKNDVWPSVNYRDYEKEKGFDTKEDIEDELDDFAKSLENEIDNIGTTNTHQTTTNVNKHIQQTASKVSSKSSSSKNNANKITNQNYSTALCNSLKADVDNVYKTVLSFIRKVTNNDVKNAFSNTQVMVNKMDRFSKAFTNAVKQNKLSPKCRASIGKKMDAYSEKYIKHLNRYSGGILKN